MIILIDGLTNAAKTLLMTLFAYQMAKDGLNIYPNYDLVNFPLDTKIIRWRRIEETFHLERGVILIDDATLLLAPERWRSLPPAFREKIIAARHQHLDIITTVQNFSAIDYRLRSNVHIRYSCRCLIRLPLNERVLPIIQISKVTKKFKRENQDDYKIHWYNEKKWIPRLLFISRLWTKTLYNTYSSLDLDRFLCKIIRIKKEGQKKGSWKIKIFSRNLINAGRARL